MAVLKGIEPEKVFGFFEEISAIPRGSGNTAAIADYLVGFARERSLEHYRDELNNVLIIAPASEGYENAETVMIQGHMDMVCQLAPDCGKDMAKEGLDLALGEDYIYARGSTLGADDGIAVAMALALLDSPEIPRPRLEAVITVDEEIGMLGAAGLDISPLKGTRLLNIDSEAEGIFTVSCAGGASVESRLPLRRERFEGTYLRIDIAGCQGGHSGIEIDKGRANPNMLMGRLLHEIAKGQELRIVSLSGGDKDNAIPTASSALVCLEDESAAAELCRSMDALFRAEYAGCDSGVALSFERVEEADMLPADRESSRNVIFCLLCFPNGVQAMSADIEGLVQSSLNLGILRSEEDAVYTTFSVRSSMDSQKRMLIERIRALTESVGGSISISGDYPGWAYRKDSPLRELMVEVYTEQYGKPPVIEAIHAGLECGLFIGKRPGLDCVSFGPNIDEIHTFREKLWISSTRRTWKMLLEVLKRMK